MTWEAPPGFEEDREPPPGTGKANGKPNGPDTDPADIHASRMDGARSARP